MSKKNQMLLNITLVMVSWLSIPFLGSRTIKRYFPAAILSIVLCSLDLQIGKRRKWWTFYNNPHSSLKNELPFLFGPMFAMAFLTLKWSYGNFKKFMLLNAIGGVIFTFPVTQFFTKLKLYKLVKINHLQFFLYFYYKAFFLYGFQYLFEKYKINKM
ncbi:hypothetical protein F4694_004332 [Bacillus niacini]|uniref:Uncharacterized protein n=1 Tax=Neobacillus niacini TaxID=86668 RepID=A0A852TH35_9BACI|nr:hypothetical protein [Neobacillus niacini]NYE07521.1 hypothetical protein [Neobacillus niacini]